MRSVTLSLRFLYFTSTIVSATLNFNSINTFLETTTGSLKPTLNLFSQETETTIFFTSTISYSKSMENTFTTTIPTISTTHDIISTKLSNFTSSSTDTVTSTLSAPENELNEIIRPTKILTLTITTSSDSASSKVSTTLNFNPIFGYCQDKNCSLCPTKSTVKIGEFFTCFPQKDDSRASCQLIHWHSKNNQCLPATADDFK